jgi:hypothetical protein
MAYHVYEHPGDQELLKHRMYIISMKNMCQGPGDSFHTLHTSHWQDLPQAAGCIGQ